jgi:hypothetical protein
MILNETRKVKIGEKEFIIKITQRAMCEYEKLSGSSITDIESHEKRLKYFYCLAKAGARSEDQDFNFSFEEFLDMVDDYYSDFMTNFFEALVSLRGDTIAEGDKKK